MPGTLLGITWGIWDACWGGKVRVCGREGICGDNVGISRTGVDLGIPKAQSWDQFGWLKPATAPKGSPQGGSEGARPKTSRKADQRRIRGEAERWTQGRSVTERCRSGRRKGARQAACKGRPASLELVGLHRVGVVRHGPRCGLQQSATGVAPRSADGFGRTVTRGCVASGDGQGPVRAIGSGPARSSIPHGSSRSVQRSHSSSIVV